MYQNSRSDEEGFPATGGGRNPLCCCVACIAIVVITVILLFASVRTVPPANLGLVVTFGKLDQEELPAGTHLCNPFASIVLFSTKMILLTQHNAVPTSEGVVVDLEVALQYHVNKEKVREIFMTIGPNFGAVLVEPELASTVRGLTSSGKAAALYGGGREHVQEEIKQAMVEALEPRGLVVESVLMKGLTLPKVLKDSIEAKARAEQQAKQMDSVLKKERQEADRKKIEAKGIAQFQEIVSKGISKELLRWKGIEATEKFSESPNTKIVMVGNSKNDLPVIMNAATKV